MNSCTYLTKNMYYFHFEILTGKVTLMCDEIKLLPFLLSLVCIISTSIPLQSVIPEIRFIRVKCSNAGRRGELTDNVKCT